MTIHQHIKTESHTHLDELGGNPEQARHDDGSVDHPFVPAVQRALEHGLAHVHPAHRARVLPAIPPLDERGRIELQQPLTLCDGVLRGYICQIRVKHVTQLIISSEKVLSNASTLDSTQNFTCFK